MMKSPLQDKIPDTATTTIDMPLLKSDARGEAVRFLQELLRLRYGYNIAVDTIFGLKTAAAVRDFQVGASTVSRGWDCREEYVA